MKQTLWMLPYSHWWELLHLEIFFWSPKTTNIASLHLFIGLESWRRRYGIQEISKDRYTISFAFNLEKTICFYVRRIWQSLWWCSFISWFNVIKSFCYCEDLGWDSWWDLPLCHLMLICTGLDRFDDLSYKI